MRNRVLVAFLGAALAACSASELNLTNPNSATIIGANADPTSLQLMATGLLADYRSIRTGEMSGLGRLGRENYVFTPQEGRNTTNYLIGITVGTKQELDPTGFITATWTSTYGAMRDNVNFRNAVNALPNTVLSATQKSAALGFAKTLEAAHLLETIITTDTLGAITQILADPKAFAPFVSRDSVYLYILGTLDSARVALAAAGGTAFPFALHSGFTGFNTPATFLKFTNALEARAAVDYAPIAGAASNAMWIKAQTSLTASFLNMGAVTAADMNVGVYHIYSSATGDVLSSLDPVTNTTLYAHPSYTTDAQLQADGITPDNRYLTKIRTGLPKRTGPIANGGLDSTSAASTIGFSLYPSSTSSVPVIRNEELILLQAETDLGLGNTAQAIADLNVTRVNMGKLPAATAATLTTPALILAQILYEKRYSVMFEGIRWADMRRYGLLNQLPLDIPSGPEKNFVAPVAPIPQAECLVRAKLSGAFLGPNGLNDCAP